MDTYYWYDGKKIPVQISTTRRAIYATAAPSPEVRKAAAAALGATSPHSMGLDLQNGIVLFDTNPSAVRAAEALPANTAELPVIDAPDSTPMIVTREFIVQFKSNTLHLRTFL